MAAIAKALADERLRLAAAVGLGGIEQGDAALDRAVDDRARALEVEPAAKVVGAQADRGHDQARVAESLIFQAVCS